MSRPSEITRDRILKTAVRLFAERGYEATSVRTLAAKAYVNQAAINYHFKTKDGLYREILRDAIYALTQDQLAHAKETQAMSRERALAEFVRQQLRPLSARDDVTRYIHILNAPANSTGSARVAQVRRVAARINPPERADTTPDTVPVPVLLPSPAVDKTSALGQALAACNQDSSAQKAFTLPGPKNEITLDRCYKGRAHLICVFTALSAEAKSLTNSYTKIVDAKYPDLTTVDGVCKLNPETLASNIGGSEDFAKRFKELKSQYAAATNCTSNVEQAFKNVTLTDMTQPPELLKSMIASIDGDGADMSEADKQISDLAEKMEASYKAMKTVTKIYHAMCMNEKAAQQSSR